MGEGTRKKPIEYMTAAELVREQQRVEKVIADCDKKIAALREKKLEREGRSPATRKRAAARQPHGAPDAAARERDVRSPDAEAGGDTAPADVQSERPGVEAPPDPQTPACHLRSAWPRARRSFEVEVI
jgi:hypothetical protein